jgi:hypothetical protein
MDTYCVSLCFWMLEGEEGVGLKAYVQLRCDFMSHLSKKGLFNVLNVRVFKLKRKHMKCLFTSKSLKHEENRANQSVQQS